MMPAGWFWTRGPVACKWLENPLIEPPPSPAKLALIVDWTMKRMSHSWLGGFKETTAKVQKKWRLWIGTGAWRRPFVIIPPCCDSRIRVVGGGGVWHLVSQLEIRPAKWVFVFRWFLMGGSHAFLDYPFWPAFFFFRNGGGFWSAGISIVRWLGLRAGGWMIFFFVFFFYFNNLF